MRFDLVITGGDVVDPGSGLVGRMDVGIRDGVIAAVERGLPSDDVGATLDATRQIVTPGLFDLHTHVYWGATYWGIEPDPIAACTGVTTWLDAGTVGGYSFPGFRRRSGGRRERHADECQGRARAALMGRRAFSGPSTCSGRMCGRESPTRRMRHIRVRHSAGSGLATVRFRHAL